MRLTRRPKLPQVRIRGSKPLPPATLRTSTPTLRLLDPSSACPITSPKVGGGDELWLTSLRRRLRLRLAWLRGRRKAGTDPVPEEVDDAI
eukprot:5497472-Alexandrium_andersonii.AAC.1